MLWRLCSYHIMTSFRHALYNDYGIQQCIQNNVASITRKYMVSFFYFFTPPRFRGGVIFSLQFVCVCVCLCVCESVCLTLFVNKFQSNGCTDLDEVFTKGLFSSLAQTLLKWVTLGQRSRSQLLKINFFLIILCYLPYSSRMFNQSEIRYVA